MFFAKKLISSFLAPTSLCVLLIGAGLVLLWFSERHRLGRILATVGFALLLLFSNQGLADLLVTPLERQNRPMHPDEHLRQVLREAGPAKHVVVLAGGHVVDPRVPLTGQVHKSAMARVIEGIRLHHQLPGSKLVLSGALAPNVPGANQHADALAAVATACGVPPDRMLLHKQGWDTEQEATSISALVGKQPFLLVTSASHMPRALALFRRQGSRPIAAPTDLLTLDEPGVTLSDFFPSPHALDDSHAAMHEYIGMVWSKLRGRL